MRPMKQRHVEEALVRIWEGHDARLGGSFHQGDFTATKADSARYFLLREIYILGRRLLEVPPISWSTADLVNKLRLKASSRPEKLGAVFHDLLMASYEEDNVISRQERWLMAHELEYALRHEVDPKLLCGFLLQSGPRKEIPRKLANGVIEPSFSH